MLLIVLDVIDRNSNNGSCCCGGAGHYNLRGLACQKTPTGAHWLRVQDRQF